MPLSGPGRQLTVHRPSQKKKPKKKDNNVTVLEQVAPEIAEAQETDAPALIALKEKVIYYSVCINIVLSG